MLVLNSLILPHGARRYGIAVQRWMTRIRAKSQRLQSTAEFGSPLLLP